MVMQKQLFTTNIAPSKTVLLNINYFMRAPIPSSSPTLHVRAIGNQFI